MVPPGHLEHYRTVQFGQLTARFFNRTDERGYPHVAAELSQELPDTRGQRQEFLTDLDRLEAVARRAKQFQEGPEREDRYERVGPYSATFRRWPTKDGSETVAFHLKEADRVDGSELTTGIDRLDAVLKEGLKVEAELRHTRNCYSVVQITASSQDESERVVATVVKSFDDRDRAEVFVHKRSDLTLWPVATRRPMREGTSFEVERGLSRELDLKIRQVEFDRGRIGEHGVIATWNDLGRPPGIGEKVRVEGTGRAYNGEPEDFRARPLGRGEQGEPSQAVHLLLRKNPNQHGVYTVAAVSTDRDAIRGKLMELEAMHQKQSLKIDGPKHSL